MAASAPTAITTSIPPGGTILSEAEKSPGKVEEKKAEGGESQVIDSTTGGETTTGETGTATGETTTEATTTTKRSKKKGKKGKKKKSRSGSRKRKKKGKKKKGKKGKKRKQKGRESLEDTTQPTDTGPKYTDDDVASYIEKKHKHKTKVREQRLVCPKLQLIY